MAESEIRFTDEVIENPIQSEDNPFCLSTKNGFIINSNKTIGETLIDQVELQKNRASLDKLLRTKTNEEYLEPKTEN